MSSNDLTDMRHSLAHILAYAVQDLYEGVKFGVGPVIDNGFYYDFDLDQTISEDDLGKIEKRMKEIIKEDYPFEREELSLADAKAKAEDQSQPYKVELINDLSTKGTTEAYAEAGGEKDTVDSATFYTIGEFTDLCRGGHAESTGKVGAFKLTRVSGAYWRGDENNPQMQRVYGVAFDTEKELAKYLKQQEEAKERDHRKLGPELGLFFMHETSPGMPYWLPNGVNLYNSLINFWRQEHKRRGYQEIVSPLMNKDQLYKTSGHYDHYWDNMFTSNTRENEVYALKAMNCPNAMVTFSKNQFSYRDLPVRYGDTDPLHRFELSGTLHGLLRVRQFRQDDAHIFVSEEMIEEEYERILEITERFYSLFDLEYKFRLGTRPDDFMGDEESWNKAEATLKKILEGSGKEFWIEEGDGAFYGPKIDIVMYDSLGREWQMGTIQLDFQQPKNFQLSYTEQDGSLATPVVIHRVIYGSMERFIGILIEHTNGHFPFWLAPEQIRILTINDQVDDYVDEIKSTLDDIILMKPLRFNEIRYNVDNRSESLGKKIREARNMRVPVLFIVGPRDAKSKVVSIKRGDNEETVELGNINEYLKQL